MNHLKFSHTNLGYFQTLKPLASKPLPIDPVALSASIVVVATCFILVAKRAFTFLCGV